ncbi:MAG: LacI family DNA-binding transcriptional regulator [Fervidobacterium sp.]|uniref:Transcriptional regulator, LacI family n=1 Tax=Fervidobacterium gondwanense DSM 13020 TaxID=1121883 RepID=A0A1M7RR64_FERGO|nr:LacI family DNA-binding transcriptional regulator [Fervidobacterium gondwanense]UXF00387.1 transcriptional regulator [Fervidobacterium riparium]SHN48582.1 transcriptional regulator, LacI family [Fervidobacterium gondwanense DSM 13020]
MATIKDVAKRAGVSISTVSYVLNNTGKISEETRQKVLRAIEELNYVPNKFAKHLKKQQYDLVALVVHEIKGPFYDALVRGIQDVLHSFGYNLLIYCTLENRRQDVDKFLRTGIVGGLLVMTPAVKNEDIVKWSKEISIVTLDRALKEKNVKSVRVDNEKGAYEVVKYLYSSGHRRIGFIKGAKDSLDAKERYKGFVRAMNELKLEIRDSDVLEGDFTEESGYSAMLEYLSSRKRKDLPTAFFCSNDEMAIGAMQALKENGLKIPDEVSIVGFDDIELASYVIPSLTTVRRPMYQLGSFAAHMLLSVIQNKEADISNVVLDVSLVIRDSTKKIGG